MSEFDARTVLPWLIDAAAADGWPRPMTWVEDTPDGDLVWMSYGSGSVGNPRRTDLDPAEQLALLSSDFQDFLVEEAAGLGL